MDLLFKKQHDFILTRGGGIKACIFDEESKQIVSNLIPYSKFQDNDFFYFDYITNKERTVISNISCVVIIRPSSLKSLIEELSSPYYNNYIILFTNQIDPFVLEILANADTKAVVSEIHEIYVDAYKQSNFLYTFQRNISTNSNSRKLEGLMSLIMSLEICPNIKIQDDNLLGLGKELSIKSRQYNFPKKGTVLILNRNFDLISPLVYDWHYQSLINEHLEYNNGIVNIYNNNDSKKYSVNDIFFESNKFKIIHSVGDEIKNLVKELERNRIRICNHQFDDIEEKAAHSLIVETHLSVYNAILKECINYKEMSENELEIIRNPSHIFSIKNQKNLDEKFIKKMILLHFIRNVNNWDEKSKDFPEFRDFIMKFKEKYSPIDFPYKPSFNLESDIKLSYECPLKRIIKHIYFNKLNNNSFRNINDENGVIGPIIIYIDGGISYNEYRDALLYAQSINIEVYFTSDSIAKINY